MTIASVTPEQVADLARRIETFVRDVVVPYETDPRRDAHGPSAALVQELRGKARAAGLMTPHILPDGSHLSQRDTARVLKPSGLSTLGPVAVNTAAPDEGNMYLIGRIGTPLQKQRLLAPLVAGESRARTRRCSRRVPSARAAHG